MDGVNQLLVQLPQAKNVTQIFSTVAAGAHSMFQGLKHVSILLLPQQGQGDSMAAPAVNKGSSSAQSSAAASNGRYRLDCSTSGVCPGSRSQHICLKRQGSGRSYPAEQLQQLLTGGHGLDWSNCSVYNLHPSRGAVVQPPASWPITCTASCYAALSARQVVSTEDYAMHGPHFLDWKCLAERGCRSMAAVPMFSCNRPVAVLCLASEQANAFADPAVLELLGGVLAPYCSRLEYTTRRVEMQRLVNEIITPIAAQLAQQKYSRLAQLGCTVEEAPGGTAPAGGKGISIAVGVQGHNNRGVTPSGPGSDQTAAAQASDQACSSAAVAPALVQRKGPSTRVAAAADGRRSPSASTQQIGHTHGDSSSTITHKRFESVIVKGPPYAADSLGPSSDLDLDWSDFFFNLVSMAIVYVYFSKAAVAEESLIAILLCMGVAAFDIVLLAMRWLWFEQYLNYGNLVLSVFQAYRAVVLPVANTWMSWSVLNKMSVTPSWPVIALLGTLLLACIVMGMQVRFFLHAPLQMASVLFAATSTPDLCGALLDNTSSLRCIGIVSAVQLALGLVLPSLLVYCLEGRPGHAFLPHMQARRLRFAHD